MTVEAYPDEFARAILDTYTPEMQAALQRVLVDGLQARIAALPGACHDREGLGCETSPCVENVSRDAVFAQIGLFGGRPVEP